MMMQTLKRRFEISGRVGLWSTGLLALASGLWREPAGPHPVAAVALAVWVELLIVLFRLPSAMDRSRYDGARNRSGEDRISWIPVVLLGFLLPGRDMLVYFLVLAGLETIRFFIGSFFVHRSGILETLVFSPEKAIDPPATVEIRSETADTVVRRLSRIRDVSGNDRLEGVFLVEFDDDRETVAVHVPFCPIFGKPPEVRAFVDEEDGIRIIIHTPRLFGVRIDVKRLRQSLRAVRLYLTVLGTETDC